MKIGIFDSGLGGLVIAKAIFKKLPKYDYIYLGDTKNLPYGEKTPDQVYKHTERAVDFLFKQDCQLIIVACNTASALALRKIQQKFLPLKYPNRRVLGVVIPTLQEADKHHKGKKIAVLATSSTVKSHIYKKELKKIDPKAQVLEIAAPKLVELIEKNTLPKAKNTLKLYLEPAKSAEALVLGCTHYPILKSEAKKIMGRGVAVVSQDDIIPNKLAEYLNHHPEISSRLSTKAAKRFYVTKYNKNFEHVAQRLFGKLLKFDLA